MRVVLALLGLVGGLVVGILINGIFFGGFEYVFIDIGGQRAINLAGMFHNLGNLVSIVVFAILGTIGGWNLRKIA